MAFTIYSFKGGLKESEKYKSRDHFLVSIQPLKAHQASLFILRPL